MDNNKTPKKPAPRKRARKADGKFKGQAAGPNEAWEPTDIQQALSTEEVKYSVKKKINTSSIDAGKYSESGKDLVRPTFGKVKTKTY